MYFPSRLPNQLSFSIGMLVRRLSEANPPDLVETGDCRNTITTEVIFGEGFSYMAHTVLCAFKLGSCNIINQALEINTHIFSQCIKEEREACAVVCRR